MTAGSVVGTQEYVPTDMNDIVHTVAGSSWPYLTTETDCDLPQVRGNQERLTDVLSALLLRAERSVALAGGTSGMIRIRTWLTGDQVRVTLSHNGLDSSTSAPCLSLIECAEIISDHGGRMFSWRPYANGASYTIVLPATRTDN